MENIALQVTFTFNREDIVFYHVEGGRHSRKKPHSLRFYMEGGLYYTLLVAFPLTAYAASGFLSDSWALAFTASVAAGAIAPYFLRWLWRTIYGARLARNQGLSGAHTVILTPQGYTDRTDCYSYTVSWGCISHLALTPHLVLAFYKYGTVTPVPRRAFATAEDAQAFYDAACRFHADGIWPPAPQSQL